MPGKVIAGHAKLEGQCGNCHVRFDREAQTRLCQDCHKPVAEDVRNKSGFHGRLDEKECRACHTEHKGRNARVVKLDEKAFDHARTDFPLRGKHAKQACKDCHFANVKHRKAASDCFACHRDDDKHKGHLGTKCANCHGEADWKQARFDHGKTRFALRGAHDDLKCDKCHTDLSFARTPMDCLSCHRKDDTHKGIFGGRCQDCHRETKWDQPTFRHDTDTRYRLLDKHRVVPCEKCHGSPGAVKKTPSRCVACHKADDTHKGSLGEKCESCHSEKQWKQARFEHNRDIRFPLRDKHAAAKCESCHKPGATTAKLPGRCNDCHVEDDRKKGHKGRYGEKCESCHNEKAFKPSLFLHDRDTPYPLRDKHRQVKCDDCHKGPSVFDKLANNCFACHERIDMDKGHKGRFGAKCETCHVEKDFVTVRFLHDRDTEFALTGKHRQAKCAACHKEPLGQARGVRRCLDCHKDDDVHFGSFDPRCDQCHVADDWRRIIKRDSVKPSP